jgi:hypothetical protein
MGFNSGFKGLNLSIDMASPKKKNAITGTYSHWSGVEFADCLQIVSNTATNMS